MSDFFVVREEGGLYEMIDAVTFCALLRADVRPAALGVAESWRMQRDDQGIARDVVASGWVYDFNLEPNGDGGYRRSPTRVGAWMEIPWL